MLSEYTHAPLADDVVEAEVILAAQAGDQNAMMDLILAYVPGLVGMVKTYTEVTDSIDDADHEVLAEFMSYVHTVDVVQRPNCGGFRAVLFQRYSDLVASRSGFSGLHRQTVSAYSRLMRAAGYDVDDAAALLGEAARNRPRGASMSESSFRAVHAALSPKFALLSTDEWDVKDEELLEEEYASIRECVDRLPSDQRAIVRYAYGFATPRAMADGEIVEEWSRERLTEEEFEGGGRVTTRATVQRKRKAALDTLRVDFLRDFNGIDTSEVSA